MTRTPDPSAPDRTPGPTEDSTEDPCPDCGQYPHAYAVFPGGRCLPCHATATAADPLPTAAELSSMWGADLLRGDR